MIDLIRYLLLTLMAVSPIATSPTLPNSNLSDRVPSVFGTLHRLDWSRAEPANIRLEGVSFTTEALKTPGSSGTSCGEVIYLTADGGQGDGRLVVEFDRTASSGHCRTVMHAVSFDAVMSHSDAQLKRSEFLVELKPGGTGGDDLYASEYAWRSTDSQTRYDLHISVKPRSSDVTPVTPTTLKVRLTHRAVDPADVDHLPFQKGFFPPCR